MTKNFKDIILPTPPKIEKNGEMIPLEFYGIVIPNSKRIQFKLGYFSTNAISILAPGFAKFIYNGGIAEFIVNHFLNPQDYDLIVNKQVIDDLNYNVIKEQTSNLTELNKILLDSTTSHFFNCLRFLLNENRLKIIPVTCADGAMSHYKEAIFTDENGNKIYINGSCNFTKAGILDNGESFLVHRNWKNYDDEILINQTQDQFDKIFSGLDTQNFIYLDHTQLEKIIFNNSQVKELNELLEDEAAIRNRMIDNSRITEIKINQQKELIKEIEIIKSRPKFPYGIPRDYQVLAYERWVMNGRKGLFAMATGTGKTITSLNCILEEWKIHNYYRCIILVPTVSLAKQWEKECINNFNFTNTILTTDTHNWNDEILAYIKAIKSGINVSFILITTYALFKKKSFQEIIYKFDNLSQTLTLIADEAHAIGAPGSIKLMPLQIENRIGLSATPERNYDIDGTLAIEDYFNAVAPSYTLCFTMKKAIEKGILSSFDYYPHFCSLNETELNEYIKITRKLTKFLDSHTGKYKDLPEVASLLMLRKNIIHKAKNKISVFEEIITREIGIQNVKNMFVYSPEGFEPAYWNVENDGNNFDEEIRLIDTYVKIFGKYDIPVYKFTGESKDKQRILSLFTNEKYKALVAMKCLDEGIDIPQTQYAIFCSSTGNSRQFIQRRGRVLRRYGDKKAKIYDIIVAPDFDLMNEFSKLQIVAEKNIFKSELTRIINFTAIAENRIEIVGNELGRICQNLDINNLIEQINNEYNRQNIDL